MIHKHQQTNDNCISTRNLVTVSKSFNVQKTKNKTKQRAFTSPYSEYKRFANNRELNIYKTNDLRVYLNFYNNNKSL